MATRQITAAARGGVRHTERRSLSAVWVHLAFTLLRLLRGRFGGFVPFLRVLWFLWWRPFLPPPLRASVFEPNLYVTEKESFSVSTRRVCAPLVPSEGQRQPGAGRPEAARHGHESALCAQTETETARVHFTAAALILPDSLLREEQGLLLELIQVFVLLYQKRI